MDPDVASGATSINVLVVEDDELVRRMLVRVLERRGFATLEAPDGRTALELVGQHQIDIVLLDNGLPDIPGTEVLAALRDAPASATLPVILVTGQADIEARVGGLRAGADDYLVKPVNMDELVARVHAQIRGRDAWRSQVQDKLHERAQLAAALAAIAPSDSPRAVAEQLTGVLAGLPGVDSVGVVEFRLDSSIHLLATTSPAWAVADRATLDAVPSQDLRRAVTDGTVVLPDELAAAVSSTDHAAVIATPVMVGGRVAAAVLLATSPGAGAEAHTSTLEVLSGAIDLAPVVERVLGPVLGAVDGTVAVVARIGQIVAAQEFHPVFQPLVELATGQVMGYEALTRFHDGVPPDQRFAEAVNVGLGVELEVATMRVALEAARRLPAGCYLSVNVSSSLLTSGEMPALLDAAGGRGLVLELTEHERIDDYTEVRAAFERLGPDLQLSVDDAGSGWSSLRHVFSLRPHFVKLDRAWVSGIDGDRARQALLLGLGRFVEELDGDLVAEGIETDAELATLTGLDIRYGQGYLLGRPAPVDELLG